MGEVMLQHVGPVTKLVTIYVAFWLGALLAHILIGYKLSTLTYQVVFLSLAGVCFGHALSSQYINKKTLSDKPLKIDRFMKLVICINLLSALWTAVVISNIGYEARILLFEDQGLYDSVLITRLVSHIIEPISYTAVILNTVSLQNKKVVFRNNALILLLMSVSTLGRFPIYFLLFLVLYRVMVEESMRKGINLKKILRSSFMLVSLVLGASIFVIKKIESSLAMDIPITETLRLYVLNYHFVGFNILDARLPEVAKESYYFPSLSAGYINWYIHLLAKAAHISNLFPNTFMLFMEKYTNGIYLEQLMNSYNAFTTHLLLIYAESGRLGVLIISTFLGYIANHRPKFINHIVSPYSLLIYFTLVFSLFQPLVQTLLPPTGFIMALTIKWLRKEKSV